MKVKCPTCGAQVQWSPAAKYRPFCSERCRLIDLGEWFEETHRLSAEPGLDDDGGDGFTAPPLARVWPPADRGDG